MNDRRQEQLALAKKIGLSNPVGRAVLLRTKSGESFYGLVADVNRGDSITILSLDGSVHVVFADDTESFTVPFASLTDAEKEIMRDDSF